VVQQSDSSAKQLSDISRAVRGDVTLENLLGVLVARLDSCRRLPIFEYEAGREGYAGCATAFRELANADRNSVNQLLQRLQDHLAETGHERNGIRP
jgi:hypothetical protein